MLTIQALHFPSPPTEELHQDHRMQRIQTLQHRSHVNHVQRLSQTPNSIGETSNSKSRHAFLTVSVQYSHPAITSPLHLHQVLSPSWNWQRTDFDLYGCAVFKTMVYDIWFMAIHPNIMGISWYINPYENGLATIAQGLGVQTITNQLT